MSPRPEPEGKPAAAGGGPPAVPAGRWAMAAARFGPAGGAAAAMAVLGLWGLARSQSMGNDEVATHWAASLSLRDLAHLLNNVDAVHGLYYLLMHYWMALGSSPTFMRIPSVISMTAAAAMVAITGRRLTGSGWAGLFAGLIMAVTPTISFYAQTARSYALVFACVLGSTLALLHAMKAEAPGGTGGRVVRRWLVYAALVTLGGYLHELSLLVLAAHAITVLLARYGLRAAVHWAATAAAGALLVTPLVVISHREDRVIGWIPRPGPTALRILFQDYFGATKVVAVVLLGCAVAAVLPPRGRWRLRPGGAAAETGAKPEPAWWSRGGISLPSVAAPLLVVPAAVLLLESLVARPLYVDRYVLYGEAGAALLAGAGVYRIGRWLGDVVDRRALFWVPGAVLCVCALLLQLGPQQRVRTPGSRLFDFGGPARYLAANARTGDGMLFFNAFYRKARLGYPRDFQNVSDFAMAVSPLQAGTFRGSDKPFDVTLPLMLARQRIWVLGRAPSAQLSAPLFRDESLVLEHRFSLVAERHFKGIVVTLWGRR
ncbi:MAG TPA: glycosyltransferase family 39 protein [Streptosporangiaceae bacterium]|nr:glycosyltransferase family 39 protein [Streptosporangiaceae bacterium]